MDNCKRSVHDVQILAEPSFKRRRGDDNSQKPHTCGIIWWSLLRPDPEMFEKHMENMLRRIVREEVERHLPRRLIVNETMTGPSEDTKYYKLVFKNELPNPVYTFSEIKAKDDDNRFVEIALYDIRSNSIVTTGGSLKVEICVIDDDIFKDGEDWTTEKFKAKTIHQIDNKGKLLKGDVVIQLKDGVGYIEKTMFTYNSSRTRTRHFRLGAIVHPTSRQAEFKEAISNRFKVLDNRGEKNQKGYPPLHNDPIWRLKNIRKDGKVYNWLTSELKINTVMDLLRVYETNPSLLKKKYWAKLKEAIKHAETCIIADPSQWQWEV